MMLCPRHGAQPRQKNSVAGSLFNSNKKCALRALCVLRRRNKDCMLAICSCLFVRVTCLRVIAYCWSRSLPDSQDKLFRLYVFLFLFLYDKKNPARFAQQLCRFISRKELSNWRGIFFVPNISFQLVLSVVLKCSKKHKQKKLFTGVLNVFLCDNLRKKAEYNRLNTRGFFSKRKATCYYIFTRLWFDNIE